MRQCLDRVTVLFVAAGECPPAKLATIGRHLQQCPKCRAAVAGVASGARLGDTVENAPAGASSRRLVKAVCVVASLAGIAHHGATADCRSAARVLDRGARASASAVEPRANRARADAEPGLPCELRE